MVSLVVLLSYSFISFSFLFILALIGERGFTVIEDIRDRYFSMRAISFD
jgi:hypothetical protein